MKAITVCRELFEARGYSILGEFVDEKGYFIKGVTREKRVVWACILSLEGKFSVEWLKQYYAYFQTLAIRHVLLVHRDSLTPSVKKTIHDLDIAVELFHIDELSYNLLKHELVPRHVVIGHERRNDQKLPILRRSDPVARFLGFRAGDVVRIDRHDGTVYIRFVK